MQEVFRELALKNPSRVGRFLMLNLGLTSEGVGPKVICNKLHQLDTDLFHLADALWTAYKEDTSVEELPRKGLVN